VNQYQATLLVAFVVVQVPIVFLLETFKFTSLMIAKDTILKTVQTDQKQDLVMLLLNMHSYGMMVLEIFWGLWLLPFGQLVYKSGFIPSILGVFLIINGMAYMIVSFTFLLFPAFYSFVYQYTFPFLFGELAIMLWLLIKGIKSNWHPHIDLHN
jgi:hypothetical protein